MAVPIQLRYGLDANVPGASAIDGEPLWAVEGKLYVSQAGVKYLIGPYASPLGDPVTPAHGGTGLSALTAHAVLLGEGTGNVAFAAAGVAGRVLIDQGAGADPAFEPVSGDAILAGSGALTLAPTGVTAGTYGDTANIPQVTLNAKGLATAAVNVPIVDLGSVNPGAALSAFAGTTTDPFATVFTLSQPGGLVGGLAVRNTGGTNSLTYRLTVVDGFGTTAGRSPTLLPGGTDVFDFDGSSVLGSLGQTAYAPFTSATLEVQSGTAGQPTTYAAQLSVLQGAAVSLSQVIDQVRAFLPHQGGGASGPAGGDLAGFFPQPALVYEAAGLQLAGAVFGR